MAVGDDEVTKATQLDQESQRTQVRRRRWRVRSAPRSSGTTSSSTTRPPRWFSRICSFRPRAHTRARCSRSRHTRSGSPPVRSGPRSSVTGATGSGAKPRLSSPCWSWASRRRSSACCPGPPRSGSRAPLLLVLLRVVQGIAIGGEWSGSVLLTMEWGDQEKRGLLGSFAQIGVPVGLVLGTGGMTLLSATLSPDEFNSWGWRIPFLASLVLVAVGLVIRLKILETPMFAKLVIEGKIARTPVHRSDPPSLAGDSAVGGDAVQRANAVLPVHHLRPDLRRARPATASAERLCSTRSWWAPCVNWWRSRLFSHSV